jgi:glycogen synthase
VFPFLQEGGLGDVVTALGRAVQDEGHDVEVILPKYDCINYNHVKVSGCCRRPSLDLGRVG